MKLLKKILAAVLVGVMSLTALVVPASAKGVFDGAKKIDAMEYYSKSFQSANDELYYKINITKPGTLTIRYNSCSGSIRTTLYNSGAEIIGLNDWLDYKNNASVTITKAGTYYLLLKANRNDRWFKDFYYTFTPTDKPSIDLKVTMKKGTTLDLGAATENYDGKVSWVSTKKTIASVSSTGKITAKKKGTTTVRAQLDNGDYVQIKVTVK